MRKATLILAALLLGCAPTAQAQPSTPQQPNTGKPRPRVAPVPYLPKQPFVKDESEFKREVLNRAPDLPDCPNYGGNAKFVYGTVTPGARGGSAFYQVYTSMDPKDQVLSWYQQTLTQYKWKINNFRPTVGLDAEKDHNYVSINTTTPSRDKSKCDFMVFFRQVKDRNGR
jgi:hypothetical protein